MENVFAKSSYTDAVVRYCYHGDGSSSSSGSAVRHNDCTNRNYNGNDDGNDSDNTGICMANQWDGDVYVYHGKKVDKNDQKKIYRVHVHSSVTMIDESAFADCTNLSNITFSNPSNVMTIKPSAFADCVGLKSLHLQDTSIVSIEKEAFAYCTNLTSVHLPKTMKTIGYESFYCCKSLTSLDLQHTVIESIESRAYYKCMKLQYVTLPTTMQKIGYESFRYCSALTTLDLQHATCLETTGYQSFSSCSSLLSIKFPKTLQKIGSKCFEYCVGLTMLNLQTTSIDGIGDGAFQGCKNLSTIILPSTLKVIGSESFRDCTSIKEIDFHTTSIRKIDSAAFCGCINLSTINPCHAGSIDGKQQQNTIMTGKNKKNKNEIIGNEETIIYRKIVFPSSLVQIGPFAFAQCPKLSHNFMNTDMIHYECDLNRGGQKFLQRDSLSTYHSSLWPLIIHRITEEKKNNYASNDGSTTSYNRKLIKFPKHVICDNEQFFSQRSSSSSLSYTHSEHIRRASIIYYLMINGIVMDL